MLFRGGALFSQKSFSLLQPCYGSDVPAHAAIFVLPVIIPHTKQASSLATAVLALLAHFIL